MGSHTLLQGIFPDLEIEPVSPALQADSLLLWREFTTEIIVEQYFPAKSGSHTHTHSKEWVRDAEAQAWVLNPS